MPRTSEVSSQRGLFEDAPHTTTATTTDDSAKRRAHARVLRGVMDRAAPGSSLPVRSAAERAMDAIRCELLIYIRSVGLRRTFQAVDFTNWLDAQGGGGMGDLRQSVDLRAIGGLFPALAKAGVIVKAGHKPNGGGKATAYHSTERPIWRVQRLDFSKVHGMRSWPSHEDHVRYAESRVAAATRARTARRAG